MRGEGVLYVGGQTDSNGSTLLDKAHQSEQKGHTFYRIYTSKQGNYSLRRPPKLVIPQAVIGQRWATVYSNLYKQTVIHSKSTS